MILADCKVGIQTNPCPGTLAVNSPAPDWTLLTTLTGYCMHLDIDGYPGSKRGVVVYQQCLSKSTGTHMPGELGSTQTQVL